MLDLIIGIGTPLVLLALGWFVGRSREKRHFQELDRREQLCQDMLVTQLKSFPSYVFGEKPPRMLVGEAVIATDYLKSFLAGLRNIFGGEVLSYETMIVRARREATLRILEQAQREGYNAICNLRLETADIGGSGVSNGNRKNQKVMSAILASATAYNAAQSP